MKKRNITVNWYYTQLDEVESLLNDSLAKGYQLVELTKKRIKLVQKEVLLGAYHLKFFGKKTTEETKEAFVQTASNSGYQLVDHTMGNVYVFYSANRSKPSFFYPNEEEMNEIAKDTVTWTSFSRIGVWLILVILAFVTSGRFSSFPDSSSHFYLITLTLISIYEVYMLLYMKYLLSKKEYGYQDDRRTSLYLKVMLDQGNNLFFLVPLIVGVLQIFEINIFELTSKLLITLYLWYVLYKHVHYRKQVGVSLNSQVSLVLVLVTVSLGISFYQYTNQVQKMAENLEVMTSVIERYYDEAIMPQSNHRFMFTGLRITGVNAQNTWAQVTVVYPFNEDTPVNLLDDWIAEALENPNALSSSRFVLVHDHFLIYATNLGDQGVTILREIAESIHE